MTDDSSTVDALRRHATVLSVDIGERSPARADRLAQAESYVRGAFEEAGLTVTEQAYDYYGLRVTNLIAQPAGAAKSQAYYVIGAHCDTVPGTPGADDNASGVAVLLEVARRVASQPTPVPVRFVAFTLEEPPAFGSRFQGSRFFAKEAERNGERVLGAIVLEMVGYTARHQKYPFVLRWAGYPESGDFIGVVSNWRSRRFARAIVKGFKGNPRLPTESVFVPLNGWVLPDTRLSDHASFWDRGWPAVMVTDTAFFRNPHYHLPSDTLPTLDFAFMAELVTGLERAVEELAAPD